MKGIKNLLRQGLKMINPKKSIAKVESYVPPLGGRSTKLRLDFNENTMGPSPKVVEAIKNIKPELISSYPEYESFYEKLSKYLGIKKSELIVTNASDEAIKLIMDTYVEEGDSIILPVPTFPMFRIYAGVSGAKIRNVFYNEDLSFPTDKVLSVISHDTKIVILVSPNNPTGTLIEKKDIVKVLKKAKNSIVLLDEAYTQFSRQTCIDLINEYDNLIILQTFSKAFGLAGLRIGYIVSCEANISNILKACSPYSVNAVAVLAASAALDDTAYIKWYSGEIEKSKRYLYEELRNLGIKAYPSYANFVLAYFGSKSKKIQDALKAKGILVRDRSLDPMLDGCLRISLGTLEQTKRLVKNLKEALNNKKISS